jgi:hypothetical protein
MDKTILDRFADGELPPEEAAGVVMRLADSPSDQTYVDHLIAANELLARAFAAPLGEPVPESIRATIFGPAPVEVAAPTQTDVVPFFGRLGRPAAALAFAASVAAAAMIWVTLAPDAPAISLSLGPLAPDDAAYKVFQSLPSGQPGTLPNGARLMVLASMKLPDGNICREFEKISAGEALITYGVACRNGGEGWDIGVLVSEPLPNGAEDQAFVTAAGPEARALTLFLNRAGAGATLSPEEEADAIADGWAPDFLANQLQ